MKLFHKLFAALSSGENNEPMWRRRLKNKCPLHYLASRTSRRFNIRKLT